MPVQLATVFGEEIEKVWQGQVSREAVFQLRLMGEQMMTMEKAIQTQQSIIEKLMKFCVLEGNALRELNDLKKKFDREFTPDTIETDHIKDN